LNKVFYIDTFDNHLLNFFCFITNTIKKMNVQPIKIYKNLEINKVDIRKDFYNKKGGIYCLVNLLNGNIYIGSSINIGQRIKNYLNKSHLNLRANKNMPICKAL